MPPTGEITNGAKFANGSTVKLNDASGFITRPFVSAASVTLSVCWPPFWVVNDMGFERQLRLSIQAPPGIAGIDTASGLVRAKFASTAMFISRSKVTVNWVLVASGIVVPRLETTVWTNGLSGRDV